MGGREFAPLMEFVERNSRTVDIFCFQEVFDTEQKSLDDRHGEGICADLFQKFSVALPDFEGSFAFFDDNKDRMSLAVFSRRSTVKIKTIEDLVIYKPERPVEVGKAVLSSRKLQYITFEFNNKEFTVANFHGLWVHAPKTDTPERIAQAETIKNFLASRNNPKILCGDFNLLPNTRSLAIMSEGMRELITEFGITSTRTPLYRHFHNPDELNFADYMLVSPDVDMKKFEVLSDVVSDHAPLYLEFS